MNSPPPLCHIKYFHFISTTTTRHHVTAALYSSSPVKWLTVLFSAWTTVSSTAVIPVAKEHGDTNESVTPGKEKLRLGGEGHGKVFVIFPV